MKCRGVKPEGAASGEKEGERLEHRRPVQGAADAEKWESTDGVERVVWRWAELQKCLQRNGGLGRGKLATEGTMTTALISRRDAAGHEQGA